MNTLPKVIYRRGFVLLSQRTFGTQASFDRKISKLWIGIGVATSSVALLRMYAEKETRKIRDCNLPLTYDPQAIKAFWSNHSVLVLVRVGEIAYRVVPFIAGTIWDNLVCYIKSAPEGKGYKFTPDEQQKWGGRLREVLIQLGPAFIKLGQIFSIRPDLLPAPVLFELQKLCDAVPPFSTEEALALIQEELNVPAESLFVGLDTTSQPVAAASLGQVYKCHLKVSSPSTKGQQEQTDIIEVAVKVQRPGMIAAVSLDLYITRCLLHCVETMKGVLMACGVLVKRQQFDVNMLDNFAAASYYELDYEHEARNQEIFASRLQAQGLHKVYIPRVYRQGTRRRVLTTEWIDGIQLAKSSPEVIRELVPVGLECFLVQLLDIGFFHGDPHPGNLLVNRAGQLVLIDFGLCAEVSPPNASGMTAALVHLVRGDVPELLNDAIALGFLPVDVDREGILPALQRIFNHSQSARKAAEVEATSRLYQTNVRRKQFRAIAGELNAVFYEYPFVVPEYFALITRALIVLEGIAVTGDPEFDIFAASYPYARKKVLKFGLGAKS